MAPNASSGWFWMTIRKAGFLLWSSMLSCGFSAQKFEKTSELIGKPVTCAGKNQVGNRRLFVRNTGPLKRFCIADYAHSANAIDDPLAHHIPSFLLNLDSMSVGISDDKCSAKAELSVVIRN